VVALASQEAGDFADGLGCGSDASPNPSKYTLGNEALTTKRLWTVTIAGASAVKRIIVSGLGAGTGAIARHLFAVHDQVNNIGKLETTQFVGHSAGETVVP
jgi:hypothetical protein